ncbi:MAG: hypothetical protein H0V82_02650 [Candidatus Protochlamydia sp.]|nr:hypothetical protein [Candidatus Protochlamydia sp.]
MFISVQPDAQELVPNIIIKSKEIKAMENDFIQLPDFSEIEEDLNLAKGDIQTALESDPSLEPLSAFVNEVIDIIKSKVSNIKDPSNLDTKTKVDLAAHMTLLNSLMDEIFLSELDELDEDEEEEEEEFDDEEK